MNSAFEDLFRPIPDVKVITSNYFFEYFSFFHYQQDFSKMQRIKKVLLSPLTRTFLYFDNENIQKVRFHDRFWDQNKKNVIIKSFSDFYEPKHGNYYFLFKPIKRIEKVIQEEVEKFSPVTFGVHVRRADNLKSINTSTDKLFIERMEEVLKKYPIATFYLATDDFKVKEDFKQLFGNKILTRSNIILTRDNKKGIEDAMIDLYVLSQTKEIFGSYWSSFSSVSASLNNIPLTIVS